MTGTSLLGATSTEYVDGGGGAKQKPVKSEFRDSGMVSNSSLDQPMSCFDFLTKERR
jgi:hypothetical protein